MKRVRLPIKRNSAGDPQVAYEYQWRVRSRKFWAIMRERKSDIVLKWSESSYELFCTAAHPRVCRVPDSLLDADHSFVLLGR